MGDLQAEEAFFRAMSSGARTEGRARRDGDWLLKQADKHEAAKWGPKQPWAGQRGS
jgi:hypothetical protein